MSTRFASRIAAIALPIVLASTLLAQPAVASDTAVLSGTVTLADTDQPVGEGEVAVTAYRFGSEVVHGTTTTDAAGEFSLNLPPQSYQLHFDYVLSDDYADEWSVDAPAKLVSDPISVPINGRVFDASLERGAVLSGTLLLPDGSPAVSADVRASYYYSFQNYDWHEIVFSTTTDSEGRWELTGLPASAYRLRFWHQSGVNSYLVQHWKGQVSDPQGTRVPVAAGEVRDGLDLRFSVTTSLSGSFSCSLCGTSAFESASVRYELQFRAEPEDPWSTLREEISPPRSTADYSFVWLETGEYRVLGSYARSGQWGYGVTPPILVEVGQQVVAPSVTMAKAQTQRVAGSNRFETTARVAQQSHPGTAAVVYVASGLSFADALSAGPAAAAAQAPLLLVNTDSIPAATANALERLQPASIVIVGGPGAVSPRVASQLARVATVTRISGDDRFATSRRLAAHAFPDGSTLAYIATGLNFPDALSAGAAAGSLGAPLVTVDGSASRLDSSTRTLLMSLGVTEVRIVGGTGSVSAGIANGLANVPGVDRVQRAAGVDRYSTSLALSDVFDNSPNVFLAVGTQFADALGGGQWAASTGSPLIVVPSNCVPSNVIDYIRVLGPDRVVLLGGTGSLRNGVAELQPCT